MSFNIDDLTYGQLKEIAAKFGAVSGSAPKSDPFHGQYVICRCTSAGVHAGFLQNQQGDIVELTQSRRLWSWKAKAGVALSGVAQNGLASGCKIDVVNPRIRLTGVIETIPCSEVSRDSIIGF